jgi:phosphohistidine phosphatase
MKQLFLLRHGEASFSQGLDFERQLTSRGREKVFRLGQTLKSSGISLDFMFCSEAQRTQETAELIEKSIEIKNSQITKKIYQGDLNTLITLLEKTPKDAETCLFVGHNPTISLLLSNITGSAYIGLQPGMMAIIELNVPEWNMIGHATGSLREILE